MFKEILKVLRIHNLILGALAVFISGYLLDESINYLTIYCALIVMITMALTYVMNDYIDVESDKINHPHRSLPSNQLNNKNIIFITLFLVFLLFVLCFQINFLAIKFLFILIMPCAFLYNFFFKNFPLIGNAVTSILLSGIFIFSEIVFIKSYTVLCLPFFLCFIFNFLREMIKDMHDYDGDLHVNSYTAPIVFGKKNMNRLIVFYTILLMIICLLINFIFEFDINFLVLLIILIEIPLLYSVFLLIKYPNKTTYKYLSDLLKYLCLNGLIIIMLTKNSYIYV